MGALSLPPAGLIYLDSNPLIYSVEKHPLYGPELQPLWSAAKVGAIEVVTSELALLETLVGPLKKGDTQLQRDYERALLGSDIRLLAITQSILREAARLRATTRLKTPDALHAATALNAGCALFITNDTAFRGTLGLPLVVLNDLISS